MNRRSPAPEPEPTPSPTTSTPPPPADDPLTLVERSLRGLRFGQIVIQVHDGAVVQIEVTEKMRPQRR